MGGPIYQVAAHPPIARITVPLTKNGTKKGRLRIVLTARR
jgi:hypothetical protein